MKQFLEFLIIVLLANLPDIEGASGQSYPSRPITLIVPFAAGGGTDIIARISAEKMSRMLASKSSWRSPRCRWHNRNAPVAKSVPDGCTLGQGNPPPCDGSEHLSESWLRSTQGFCAGWLDRDDAARSRRASIGTCATVQELIALSKKDPGRLTFGSGGTGGVTHLAGELFASIAAIKISPSHTKE
jgi:hypothetical protein